MKTTTPKKPKAAAARRQPSTRRLNTITVRIPTTGYAAVLIAKVTNTAGVITVNAQYATHNPTVFLPVVNVLAFPTPP
jgi:hypothetical protein